MPSEKVDIKKRIAEKKKNDKEFRKAYDEVKREKKIQEIFKVKNKKNVGQCSCGSGVAADNLHCVV